ncbi:MAG: hypothetical protein FLDDKLPJ_01484 [Phycisphaerae bacterium]|nr:hypothetical protein [Phycisphaerae bacterium]
MRDGSGDVLLQAYYGTQYIDEIVALKLEHGYAVVSQDANYNVTTLTDLDAAGRGKVRLKRLAPGDYECAVTKLETADGDPLCEGRFLPRTVTVE